MNNDPPEITYVEINGEWVEEQENSDNPINNLTSQFEKLTEVLTNGAFETDKRIDSKA